MLRRFIQLFQRKWFSLTKDELEELEEIDLIADQIIDELNLNPSPRVMI